MAEIKITDISLTGNDLFDDDEDFMDDMYELNEDIFERVKGGIIFPVFPLITIRIIPPYTHPIL